MQSPAAIPACDPSAVSRMGPRSHGTGSGVLSQKSSSGVLSQKSSSRWLLRVRSSVPSWTHSVVRSLSVSLSVDVVISNIRAIPSCVRFVTDCCTTEDMQWSLGVKGALHCPGGAEMILWRRRRTQEPKCTGGRASSCGVLDRFFSSRVLERSEAGLPGEAGQLSFAFSTNLNFSHFSYV